MGIRGADRRPWSRRCRRAAAAASLAAALLLPAGARACDGKSYSFNIAPGAIVSGGGLSIRLDKAKLLDEIPDKYFISVKDDGQVLADHVVLVQHDTVDLKTRCGTVSIGADRKSIFTGGTLALNWSYF